MKLILHIGGAKCGSSAIQRYNATHRDRLASQYVCLVPDTTLGMEGPFTGEQIFFFEQMRKDKENGVKIVASRMGQLKRYMQQHGLQTLIVSAENLINLGGCEKLFASVASEFDVEIVLYVRRQDQYFVSAWQQWHLKTYASPQAYVDARLGIDANWTNMLRPWEEQFTSAKFNVRIFQRNRLIEQDVVADFYATSGLGGLLEGTQSLVANKSFSEHLGDMACRVQDVFDSPHDNAFYEVMADAIGAQAFKKSSGSHIYTLQEREDILDAYADCNEQLRQKYFPDIAADIPLFDPPTERDVVVKTDEEKSAAEIDLLTRAVFGMLQQLRKRDEAA
ncbi:MAG: hypothetical protein ABJQ66_04925 [Paracoccaceae bacterium]